MNDTFCLNVRHPSIKISFDSSPSAKNLLISFIAENIWFEAHIIFGFISFSTNSNPFDQTIRSNLMISNQSSKFNGISEQQYNYFESSFWFNWAIGSNYSQKKITLEKSMV